jgi:hypothetical protein
VQLLIDAGANINITDNNQRNERDLARIKGHDNIAMILEQTQAANTSVPDRLAKGDAPKTIIADGAQPTIVFEDANPEQKQELLQEYPRTLYDYIVYNASVAKRFSEGDDPASIIEDGIRPATIFKNATPAQQEQLLEIYPHLQDAPNFQDIIAQYNVPQNWLLYSARSGDTNILKLLLQKDTIRDSV